MLTDKPGGMYIAILKHLYFFRDFTYIIEGRGAETLCSLSGTMSAGTGGNASGAERGRED